MLRFVCVTLLISLTLAGEINLEPHWENFKSTFKKSFNSEQEENERKELWESGVQTILKHNLEADMGLHTYKLGVNKFVGMTPEEFQSNALGLVLPENITYNYLPPTAGECEEALPENFDWRDQGAVTPVKDQGDCHPKGCCWTFSVAGTLEGYHAIKTGKLVELSEQELLDCSRVYGTTGCSGGWPKYAYNYVAEHGIGKYSCYPYETEEKTCRAQESCKVVTISGYRDVPQNENDLKRYLYKYGPVSVSVKIKGQFNFQLYGGGIFDDPNCNAQADHAVLLVGYGVENGTPYWTIKNSWGERWGVNGYMKMARGKGMCGIDKYAIIPW